MLAVFVLGTMRSGEKAPNTLRLLRELGSMGTALRKALGCQA